MPRIDVNLPNHSYPIVIESGLLTRLGEVFGEFGIRNGRIEKPKILLAVDSAIAANHGEAATNSLSNAEYDVHVHSLIADEKQKSLSGVHGMYDAMLNAKLERSDFVIALGGGIVGDVAGFAAATYLRGVPIVQIPTTLLAMVDAAIGGKTGVNIPLPDAEGTLGKNLIGAFWQPHAVFVDPQVLATLNDRHFRCGLAECIKHGMIADATLLGFLHKNCRSILARDMNSLTALIHRSAGIKAGIVAKDERENHQRAWLNLGHTFAHAIEPIAEIGLHHGEAVAIGLIAAMHCSIETNRMKQSEADTVRSLLTEFGLPTSVPKPVAMSRIISAMGYDKKVRGGQMRLVLPLGLGGVEIVSDVPTTIVESALKRIGAGD